MLIKTRKAKNSARGLYLQDRQLQKTVFQPGTHFKYVIDVASKKVIILSSEEEGNTVSKRDLASLTKPVIDIRNKEALAAFDGCDYLQVEIHEEQIVVSGYAEQKDTLLTKAKRSIEKVMGRKGKVVDITHLLNVKKKAEIVLAKSDLSKVVGGYEQLSFTFEEDTLSYNPSSVAFIQSALKHLHLALQVDSLFTGSGLLDLGFIQEGFQIAFAVEKNKEAVQTYRANLGNHILEADITTVDKSRYTSPIMIGGSPCQGFSNSNRYTNFLDNPNNRLVLAYIEAVKTNKNCQIFVLENVPQILTAGDGKFRDEILHELSDFEIEFGTLNAADFRAPQERKRAIFIGSKIGRIKLPEPQLHPSEYVTVRQAFRGVHAGMPNQLDVSAPKEITMERIRSVPPGGNVHDIPESIRPKGRHSDMYKRLLWDEPAVTVVNPRKTMLLHPEEDRILSIREAARLQGVPDNFVFHGGMNAKQQQVANGVPVHLSQAIANAVRKAVEMFNIRNRTSHAFA